MTTAQLPRRTGKSLLLTGLLLILLTVGLCGTKAHAASTYTIYVNRQTNIVNVVNTKTKKTVRSMYCSTGKNNRTITGTFATKEKMRWHALFGGVYGQYCTRISGHYLFHSVPYYSKRNNRVSTTYYNQLGKQASAGCIRLAVADSKWIYDNCSRGTKVVIGDRLKLQTPTRKPVRVSTKSRSGWDPTDPAAANPYRPTIKRKSGTSKTIPYGASFDPLSRITVSSPVTKSATLRKNITVSGAVDTSRPGSYTLKYTVTDPNTLLTKSLTITYTVQAKPDENSASAAA